MRLGEVGRAVILERKVDERRIKLERVADAAHALGRHLVEAERERGEARIRLE